MVMKASLMTIMMMLIMWTRIDENAENADDDDGDDDNDDDAVEYDGRGICATIGAKQCIFV